MQVIYKQNDILSMLLESKMPSYKLQAVLFEFDIFVFYFLNKDTISYIMLLDIKFEAKERI